MQVNWTWGTLGVSAVIALVGFAYRAGCEDGDRAVRDEAVKTGVARYRVSQITGEADFEWVTPDRRNTP